MGIAPVPEQLPSGTAMASRLALALFLEGEARVSKGYLDWMRRFGPAVITAAVAALAQRCSSSRDRRSLPLPTGPRMG
jgi:hypothetical protein